MKSRIITKEEKLYLVRNYTEKNMPKKPYHNFPHALEVSETAALLAQHEELESQDIFLLKTAGYLHDIIHKDNYGKNEEDSAHLAAAILPTLGYQPNEIETIKQLILATKFPPNPKNKLEQIICDADLDNLGREDFFEKSLALQKERGKRNTPEWWLEVYKFLQNHQYHTEAARKIRGAGLEKNRRELREMIIDFAR